MLQPLIAAHAPVVQVEPDAQILRQPLLTQVIPPWQSPESKQEPPAPLKPDWPQSTTSRSLPTFCTWQPCPEGHVPEESGLQGLLHSCVLVPVSV